MRLPWNRGGIRSYLMLLGLVAGTSTHVSVAAGSAVLAVGVLLHFWSKGCLKRNLEVTTSGAYRFVRHPFYLANALIDAGIVDMSGCWLLAAAAPLLWLWAYVPTIRREEAYLTQRFGQAYATYRRQVPVLLPWRRPLPHDGNGSAWQFQNILNENEIPRALRLLACPLPFCMLSEIHAHGWAMLDRRSSVSLALAGAWLAMYAAAWAAGSWTRSRAIQGTRPVAECFLPLGPTGLPAGRTAP